jgi:proteasome lid subunit RPN8/RPN11
VSKRKKKKPPEVQSTADTTAPNAAPEPRPVKVGDWTDRVRPVWRTFPGPRRAGGALRVAMDRSPYAELLAHAKESLEVEVCGVLVGDVCEDEEGVFVHVKATVRGTTSKAGGAHVTYTQETWNRIHQEMEDKHPKRAIVGWYHTHPGFGVTFSEMDAFIQNNFFSGPTQIALVLDPLGGGEAIGVNGPRGLEYVDHFWVDGRERPAFTPKFRDAAVESGAAVSAVSAEMAERLEVRVTQLVHAVEEQRILFHRFLLAVGMVVATGVIMWIGWSIWSGIRSDREPPRLADYIPVPIQVGDRQVLMGVGIFNWDVPRDLNAAYVELERQRREAREDAQAPEPRTDSADAPGARKERER